MYLCGSTAKVQTMINARSSSHSKLLVSAEEGEDSGYLNFLTFSLEDVLRDCTPLLGSSGTEFEFQDVSGTFKLHTHAFPQGAFCRRDIVVYCTHVLFFGVISNTNIYLLQERKTLLSCIDLFIITGRCHKPATAAVHRTWPDSGECKAVHDRRPD